MIAALMLPAAFLFVHIYDVLHKQVSLQAIHPVSIQNHFMSTGWAAKPSSRTQWRTSPRRQVGVWGLTHTHTYMYTFGTCFYTQWLWVDSICLFCISKLCICVFPWSRACDLRVYDAMLYQLSCTQTELSHWIQFWDVNNMSGTWKMSLAHLRHRLCWHGKMTTGLVKISRQMGHISCLSKLSMVTRFLGYVYSKLSFGKRVDQFVLRGKIEVVMPSPHVGHARKRLVTLDAPVSDLFLALARRCCHDYVTIYENSSARDRAAVLPPQTRERAIPRSHKRALPGNLCNAFSQWSCLYLRRTCHSARDHQVVMSHHVLCF